MKHRFKKILAAVLSASLCVPALPTAAIHAAEPDNAAIVWTDAENISATQISEDERVINFNEEWKFYLGDSTTAQNKDFIDASWDEINLPHDFSIFQDFTPTGEAESGFLPGGTGWYRKKLSLPESFSDKSVVLNFDGAYKDTYVYVNGTKVGEHHYGYTPFAFDISEYLTCDNMTENIIAVKVVNQLPSSRWYSGSGIYRDVTLIVTNPVHVDVNGTYVTTPKLAESSGSDGTVNIAADIKNDNTAAADITVRNTIFEKNSSTSAATVETEASVAAGETKSVTATAKVANPKLWSTKIPNLYTVRTEVLQAGKVIDTYETEFGFKWYEFADNTGFKLNGENMKINGVCMHHDQGALGAAAYHDAIYRQMSTLKNMGVNTIRVTHNPAAAVLVDVCNELGLLVIEEAFDGWGLPKNGNSNDFSVYFDENLTEDNQIIGGKTTMTWAEFAIKSMVKRDRNDASIIMWSLCNEVSEGAGNNYTWGETTDKLIRWIREVDTAHLPTSGSNRRSFDDVVAPVNQKIFEAGGVVGYNYGDVNWMNTAHGRYPVMLWSETASAINSRGIYTSQESGANADGKYHLTSYDTSRVGWGKTAHASMYPTLSNDYIAGECVWTGFDYIGEPTPWNGTGSGDGRRGSIPNSSYFGIVETTGFPKDNYYLYRSQWNHDANTLHLVTAWDPDNKMDTDGKTPVWVYSNAAKVELYLNDQKIGTATRKDLSSTTTAAGHVRYEYTTESNNSSICTTASGNGDQSLYSVFNVAFTAGTISAKAYDENNQEITNTCEGKTSVSTPGAANKLIASTDKDSIDADGSSLSYITVDVTDANGNLKTTADNQINFTLIGEGEIVGVDNGDQATVDKYQQNSVLTDSKTATIKAYAGKALVIVRSTKNSGSFTLNAASNGLTGASVTVQTDSVGTSTGAAIKSYTMSRHCYLPVDSTSSDVKLPETVKALLTDGTEKTLNVNWADYDDSILNTKGNYTINGSMANENEIINVFVILHVYDEIIGVQNHSLCTAPNTMPTLPTVCMSYDIDGDAFVEYPVTWDLTGITTDTFATMNNIIKLNGTVSILGKIFETQASVRVAEPNVTYENVAKDRDHLTDNAFENGTKTNADGSKSYDDNLLTLTDTNRKDNNPNGLGHWSDWGHRATEQTNIKIAMDWATATTTNLIDIYYINTSTKDPTIKFEYATTSNYDEEDKFLKSSAWQTIEHTKLGDSPEQVSGSKGIRYQLSELINPQALCITFGHPTNTFIGITEIEVLQPTYTYDLNTNAALSGVTINEKTITFNNTATEYDVDVSSIDIRDITFENPENAAVTLLQLNNKTIKIISASEDGQQTKTYTLQATQENIKQDLLDLLKEYQKLKEEDYTAESYEPFISLIEEIEQNIDSYSEADIQTKMDELKDAYKNLETVEDPNPPSETKTELLKKLEQYQKLDASLYTEESYQKLKNLMDEIEQNIDTYTESELQEKLTELDNARNNLKPLDATAELRDKLEQYKSLTKEDYTEESYQKLQDLIKTIESEMDSYTEDQIQTALTDLEKAYNALEKVEDPNPPKPDKNELQAKLDEYKQLDKKLFTPASYEKLQNLIKEIEGQIDDLSAEEIEAKLAELEECKEALVPDEPKTSTINTLKDRIQYCQKTYATAAYNTLKPLVTSISSTMNTLSESQLQAKLKELNTKMNGLLTKATLNRLQGKINSYSALKRTNYTTASYNTLLNLINQTKRMINTYTTEKQAASQITALDNAYKKLQKYVPPAPTLEEGDSITTGNVEYEVIDAAKRTVSATLASKKATKVTIKDTVTINNIECTVVQIPDNAFKTGAKKLKSVTIGKNIVSIGKNAFNGCKKLNKITFNNSNVKFSKKAFSKTNSKITVKVKGLKKSKRNAFKKKLTNAGMSKKVKIK